MILAILQGRLSSTRLPGKVLKPVRGVPMILRQIERIQRSHLVDRLVVATSLDPSDDPLVAALEAHRVEVRRGPLDDVAERFRIVVDEMEPDTIVRLTADCPLADPAVIDAVISAHLAGGADYTANTIEPTYPDGLDVECMSREAFDRMLTLSLTAREREHVTLGIHGRGGEFVLRSVRQGVDRSSLRWTVDVPDDLEFVRSVYDHLYESEPAFGQDSVLALLEREPSLNRTESDMARNAGLTTD